MLRCKLDRVTSTYYLDYISTAYLPTYSRELSIGSCK